MNSDIFAALMAASALHAGWNVIVRGAGDRTIMMVGVALLTSVIAAVGLPLLAAPDRQAWVNIAISIVIHVVSFDMVARTYSVADMGLAYPLMRGTAPLLTALVSIIMLRDYPTAWSCAGITIISLGVFGLVAHERSHWSRSAIVTASANAVLIAAYTLIDGAGMRATHGFTSYVLWVFLGSGLAYTGLWAAKTRLADLGTLMGVIPWGVGGALASIISYGIALWAMTQTSIAVIAATRETSIAFGVMFSIVFLKERLAPVRVAASAAIMAGAIVLRMA